MRVLKTLPFVLATLATVGAAQAGPARDPSGTWLTGDGRARIKVERCGIREGSICGTVVWLKTPLSDQGQPRTDLKNPDPGKRNRPVIGMPIMAGLTPEEGKFKGEIYNSDEGRNYDVWVGLESANALNVQGCVLGGLICGSQTWTRVQDVAQTATAKPAGGTGAAARTARLATATASTVAPDDD